jgi:hypothetical protein
MSARGIRLVNAFALTLGVVGLILITIVGGFGVLVGCALVLFTALLYLLLGLRVRHNLRDKKQRMGSSS